MLRNTWNTLVRPLGNHKGAGENGGSPGTAVCHHCAKDSRHILQPSRSLSFLARDASRHMKIHVQESLQQHQP